MIGVVDFCIRIGGRPAYVSVCGCATRMDVFGVEYGMCFVCVIVEKLDIC